MLAQFHIIVLGHNTNPQVVKAVVNYCQLCFTEEALVKTTIHISVKTLDIYIQI